MRPIPGICPCGWVLWGVLVSEPRYEENSRRVELRPIVDREFERWQIVFNPVFERRPRRTGRRPWLELRTGDAAPVEAEEISPSLEYYGEVESINVRPRAQPEVHQLFRGGD
jgi:hypothetical protein